MDRKAVDTKAVLASFSELWSPRTVAIMNDYDVRVVKVQGEFTRHCHPETNELFFLLSGRLVIKMDELDVELLPGQLFVVPRGLHHQPVSSEGAEVLLIEPSTTVNTGDTPSEQMALRGLPPRLQGDHGGLGRALLCRGDRSSHYRRVHFYRRRARSVKGDALRRRWCARCLECGLWPPRSQEGGATWSCRPRTGRSGASHAVLATQL
jgi:mannose-6-phosphate isomerase-like protein (cupin superfamily)